MMTIYINMGQFTIPGFRVRNLFQAFHIKPKSSAS
jgi:hypothetical protein